jgi:hypothetical protein
MTWNKRFTVNPGETVEQAVKRELEHIPVNCPIVDGKQINDIPVTATWNLVEHGLGRKPTGGFLVRSNHGAVCILFFYQGAGAAGAYDATDKYIYVYCATPHADGRVAIWIY